MPVSKLAAHIAATMTNIIVTKFEVFGNNGNKYIVDCVGEVWSCTCKAYKFGKGKPCKHIRHVVELQEWEKELT